jgi:hypothetical protein
MKNVYLVKDGGTVLHYYDKAAMRAAGYNEADKTVTDEEFGGAGCYARVINGVIVVGKTEEEKNEELKQERIAEYKEQLEQIDLNTGAGRKVRKVACDLGELVGAFRRVSMDFATAINIMHQQNGELAEFDPQQNESLKLIMEFDPETNEEMESIRSLESKAAAIRERLRPLLAAE